MNKELPRTTYVVVDIVTPVVTISITPEVVAQILNCDKETAKTFLKEVDTDFTAELDSAVYDVVTEWDDYKKSGDQYYLPK